MRRERDNWEQNQKEWWEKRHQEDEQRRQEEQTRIRQLQEDYEQIRQTYERKREETLLGFVLLQEIAEQQMYILLQQRILTAQMGREVPPSSVSRTLQRLVPLQPVVQNLLALFIDWREV